MSFQLSPGQNQVVFTLQFASMDQAPLRKLGTYLRAVRFNKYNPKGNVAPVASSLKCFISAGFPQLDQNNDPDSQPQLTIEGQVLSTEGMTRRWPNSSKIEDIEVFFARSGVLPYTIGSLFTERELYEVSGDGLLTKLKLTPETHHDYESESGSVIVVKPSVKGPTSEEIKDLNELTCISSEHARKITDLEGEKKELMDQVDKWENRYSGLVEANKKVEEKLNFVISKNVTLLAHNTNLEEQKNNLQKALEILQFQVAELQDWKREQQEQTKQPKKRALKKTNTAIRKPFNLTPTPTLSEQLITSKPIPETVTDCFLKPFLTNESSTKSTVFTSFFTEAKIDNI